MCIKKHVIRSCCLDVTNITSDFSLESRCNNENYNIMIVGNYYIPTNILLLTSNLCSETIVFFINTYVLFRNNILTVIYNLSFCLGLGIIFFSCVHRIVFFVLLLRQFSFFKVFLPSSRVALLN